MQVVPCCCQVQSKSRSQFLGPLCLWQCFISEFTDLVCKTGGLFLHQLNFAFFIYNLMLRSLYLYQLDWLRQLIPAWLAAVRHNASNLYNQFPIYCNIFNKKALFCSFHQLDFCKVSHQPKILWETSVEYWWTIDSKGFYSLTGYFYFEAPQDSWVRSHKSRKTILVHPTPRTFEQNGQCWPGILNDPSAHGPFSCFQQKSEGYVPKKITFYIEGKLKTPSEIVTLLT